MATTCTLPPHLSRFGLQGCCKGSAWSVMALESVSCEVTVRGFVAQTCAKLVYLNNSPETLQVQAVYPVDEGAAVYHLEAKLGDRTIVTHCLEKKKAEKMYQDAVQSGHRAVMGREDEDSGDIIKLNLGNLPAKTRAEITLKMVMELKVQSDGGISFVLPTVLNPRYCPPEHPRSDPQDGGFFGGPFNHIVHVPKPYSIDVKASVSGCHKIARVTSTTDPINATLADDTLSAVVTQDGGFNCDHDWSFVVYYNNPYAPHVIRETGDRSASGLMKDDLLMLNFFPEVPKNTYSSKNEIIFVIDRSGSMGGSKMQSAKTTLLLFLKSLPPGCLFNVVSFGSHFSLLFPEGSREYTEKNLEIACNLQATMDASMGGTEILRPLQSIYAKPPTPGYSRQLILITDGEVWNIDTILQLVGRHAHETRLFAVGIGHGASTALVRGVARAGRGRSEMVAEESILQQKVMGLVASMVQESVQEVTISCEVEPTSRVTLVPKVPPVIFGGQHLILYARVPATTQVKSVSVSGQLGARPLLSVVQGQEVNTVHDEAKSIHRLAARAQILQWQLDEEEDIAEDMVALSTASGVVSRRTALIGIDAESGKAVEKGAPIEMKLCGSFGGCVNTSMPRGFMMKKAAKPTSQDHSISPPAAGFSPMSISTFDSAISFMAEGGRTFGSRASGSSLPPLPAQYYSSPSPFSKPTLIGGGGGPLPAPPSPPSEPTGFLALVGSQQFDGSWKLADAAKLTDVSLHILTVSNPAKTVAAWATALVLVLLEKKYSDKRQQWALMCTKAQTFITSRGEDLEELLAKARVILSAQ